MLTVLCNKKHHIILIWHCVCMPSKSFTISVKSVQSLRGMYWPDLFGLHFDWRWCEQHHFQTEKYICECPGYNISHFIQASRCSKRETYLLIPFTWDLLTTHHYGQMSIYWIRHGVGLKANSTLFNQFYFWLHGSRIISPTPSDYKAHIRSKGSVLK